MFITLKILKNLIKTYYNILIIIGLQIVGMN